MPSSAARAASAGIRHAPSRIEYSEWTWRWTNEVAVTNDLAAARAEPQSRDVRCSSGETKRVAWARADHSRRGFGRPLTRAGGSSDGRRLRHCLLPELAGV